MRLLQGSKPQEPPRNATDPLRNPSADVSPEDVAEIVQSEQVGTPDPLAINESKLFEQGLSEDDIKQQQKRQEQHEVHQTRLGYVPKLFWLIVCSLGVATAIMIMPGFNWKFLVLSDKVLIALITSTTANVLGLFYVVAKRLYPAPPSEEKKSKTKKGKFSITPDEE